MRGKNARLLGSFVIVLATIGLPLGAARADTPSNDSFASAREVTTLPFSDTVHNADAQFQPEPGEPKPSCALGGNSSVWYRFRFDVETSLRVQSSGSDHDSVVAIFRGDDLAGLTEAACNDDFTSFGPSRVLFTARPSVLYYVQASGVAGAAGTLRIAFDPVVKPATVGERLPFTSTAPDGVSLRGHVYLPDGPGPFATVLELSPYWNTQYIATEDAEVRQEDRTTLWFWLGPYLDAGFAVALVNIRGFGESDGCPQLGNATDVSDAARVVQALAAQPWSNGSVGMTGFSYPGWTQFWAAAARPPALKAIVPVDGIVDGWQFLTRNGAAWTTGPFAPTLLSAVWPHRYTPEWDVQRGHVPFAPHDSPQHVACPQNAEASLAGVGVYTNGDRSPWMEERDLRAQLATSDVAVFATFGLTFADEMMLQAEDVWNLGGGDKRLLLGHWDHSLPRRSDFADQAVGWFDHYLRGGPAVTRPGVVEYQDAEGGWHTSHRWPASARTTTLHLSGRSLITDRRAGISATQTFPSGEADPYPLDCPDQALYVSPPLAEDVFLAGYADVRLTMSSTLPDGNIAAYLWHTDDVDTCDALGDRIVEYGSTGWYHDLVFPALTDLRHRDGSDHGSDAPVGVPTEVSVRSYPFARHVHAGERLVLAIGGGSLELAPEARKPVLTVHSGPGIIGEISVPVVDGTLRFVE
jgi:predicted acyl esterase